MVVCELFFMMTVLSPKQAEIMIDLVQYWMVVIVFDLETNINELCWDDSNESIDVAICKELTVLDIDCLTLASDWFKREDELL